MRTFFYIVWSLFPLAFLLIALWAKLEQMGNKQKRENPGDFLRQAGFLLVCLTLSVLIDQLLLELLVTSIAPDLFPLWFFQALLFPLVMYVLAKVIGPSKSILIERTPHVTSRKRR